jgi:hypothetical protein
LAAWIFFSAASIICATIAKLEILSINFYFDGSVAEWAFEEKI